MIRDTWVQGCVPGSSIAAGGTCRGFPTGKGERNTSGHTTDDTALYIFQCVVLHGVPLLYVLCSAKFKFLLGFGLGLGEDWQQLSRRGGC